MSAAVISTPDEIIDPHTSMTLDFDEDGSEDDEQVDPFHTDNRADGGTAVRKTTRARKPVKVFTGEESWETLSDFSDQKKRVDAKHARNDSVQRQDLSSKQHVVHMDASTEEEEENNSESESDSESLDNAVFPRNVASKTVPSSELVFTNGLIVSKNAASGYKYVYPSGNNLWRAEVHNPGRNPTVLGNFTSALQAAKAVAAFVRGEDYRVFGGSSPAKHGRGRPPRGLSPPSSVAKVEPEEESEEVDDSSLDSEISVKNGKLYKNKNNKSGNVGVYKKNHDKGGTWRAEVHKKGVLGKTSLGSGYATKELAAEAVAAYLRGDRSAQRVKAKDSPPAFSSSAYSAVLLELMSLKVAHKQLVEEKSAVEEALQKICQQVKMLRNQVFMRRFLDLPEDVVAHVVTFLAVSETVKLDTACCSLASRELLNSALLNMSIPAFDDFCFRSTSALEWVLQKKIHLDSLNCKFGTLQPGQNSLSYAISQGSYAVAKMIMLSGSEDVNSMIEYSSPSGPLKWAPIHRFASLNDTKALNFLLTETNCNVQTTDSRGWTALHWACLRESYGAAQVLLQHGSDLEAVTDHPSRTPLLISCQRGDILTTRALIEAGAKLDAMDESKNSAILICVQFKAFECCKLLLENSAPANIKCASGWTALRLALTFQDDRLAELLLQSKQSLL